jgi:tRNA threonylcarbamoyladenosine biosynthesis protein TsaE
MQQSISLAELPSFAADFWKIADNKKVFAVHGPMGAGKTTIIAALCKHKGVLDAISSPTFSIINEYNFFENQEYKKIFHIDLYRLKNIYEIIQAGVEDCIYSGEICMIEWAEKALHLLSEDALHIIIKPKNSTLREIKMCTSEEFNPDSIT